MGERLQDWLGKERACLLAGKKARKGKGWSLQMGELVPAVCGARAEGAPARNLVLAEGPIRTRTHTEGSVRAFMGAYGWAHVLRHVACLCRFPICINTPGRGLPFQKRFTVWGKRTRCLRAACFVGKSLVPSGLQLQPARSGSGSRGSARWPSAAAVPPAGAGLLGPALPQLTPGCSHAEF